MLWGKRSATATAQHWWPAAPGWTTLPASMDAVAANPNDVVARERLAVHFAGLSQLQSPLPRNKLGLLPGFMRRPDMDALQDCFMADRAIRELSALVDHGPEIHQVLREAGLDVADLIGLRGVLYEGFWQTALGAEQCELAAAHVPYERENSADRANALRHKAAMLRAEIAMRPALSQVQVAELHKMAERIGGRTANAVSFTPIRWVEHPAQPADVITSAVFRERVAEAEAHPELTLLGWMENASYAEQYGHRGITAVFTDQFAHMIAISGTHKLCVVDMEAMLSDGSIAGISMGRGALFFEPGPHWDRMLVDPMPIADALPIHRSLAQLTAARRAGASVLPVHSMADAIQVQEQGRKIVADYRLAVGLSDTEVRAIGFADPDVAMYAAQSAARKAVQAAHDAAVAAPVSSTAA